MSTDRLPSAGTRPSTNRVGWPSVARAAPQEPVVGSAASSPLLGRTLWWTITLSVALLGARWGSEVGTVRQLEAERVHFPAQEALDDARQSMLESRASTDDALENLSESAVCDQEVVSMDAQSVAGFAGSSGATVLGFGVGNAESNGISAALASGVGSPDFARLAPLEEPCADACWRLLWAPEPMLTEVSFTDTSVASPAPEPAPPAPALATMVPGENDAVLRLVPWDSYEDVGHGLEARGRWQAKRRPVTETVGASAVRVATETKAWLLQWANWPRRSGDAAGWRLSWAHGLGQTQRRDCNEAACAVLRIPFLPSFSLPASNPSLLPVTSSSSSFPLRVREYQTPGSIHSQMR